MSCNIVLSTQAKELDIDVITGVYKYSFRNMTADDKQYTSEDILEIVKYSPTAVYFRANLQFNSGHYCDLYGIAEKENDELIYHEVPETKHVDNKKCILKIKINNDTITFEDIGGSCAFLFCGARGYYEGNKFKLSTRRDIRYMRLILKSREYLSAVKEYMIFKN